MREDLFRVIKERKSVRTYAPKTVSASSRDRIEKCMLENGVGPFGNTIRFQLLDLEGLDQKELRSLGTYGIIKGARLYLLAAVMDRQGSMEDLGYCMERVLLEATDIGLGTCWMAGTFRRSSFAEKIALSEGELLPAISPMGYPAEKRSLLDRLMRKGAGSKQRKPWEELFYTRDGEKPLTQEEAGVYRDPLEAVRLGPSSTNRQPWRIIRDDHGQYHLYLRENRLYNRSMGKIRIQQIDMGIAMCHFQLMAEAKGISGGWRKEEQPLSFQDLIYTATWKEF